MLTVVNLPNFLTILRLLAIPFFLILLEDNAYGWALAVFVAAGITDGLDGAIARLTDSKTELGAIMDPAADKLLLLAAFIGLGFMHQVPRWLTVIVISRDVLLVLGYFILFIMTQETIEIRPTLAGKLSTFFLLSGITAVLVELTWPATVPPVLRDLLHFVAATLTTAAGLQYLYRGLAWLQHHEANPPSASA